MKKFSRISVLLPIVLAGFLLCGCPKPDHPKGFVTVLKKSGGTEVPASEAWVRVQAAIADQVTWVYKDDGTMAHRWEQQTDGSGSCTFQFKHPAIVKVIAWQKTSDNATDSLYGEGILILKEDQTAEETVVIE